ncbi:MAG: hypothetical protein QOI31_2160 [Solirubrobacterales bacterium]|nr:hypothetical protein [Solirubrobacterales bacterium]
MTERNTPLPRIDRIYAQPGPDGIVLYAGDLEVQTNAGLHRANGQIELHLFPKPWFGAHFKGPFRDLGPISLSSDRRTVAIPANASLEPPPETTLTSGTLDGSWAEIRESIGVITAGNLAAAERFVIHFAGALRPRFRSLQLVEGGHQGRIEFALPGWQLTLVSVDHGDEEDFDGMIEARPTGGSAVDEDIGRLRSRLFAVLGLVAGREVGVGPICGIAADSKVAWVEWGAPRNRVDPSAVRWCPPDLVPGALPAIASGYSAICGDNARETIVERAIEMLLSADSAEVVDVRIPVAGSGLELLSWAILRIELGMSKKKFKLLDAGEACARLCDWAEIPTAVPESLPHLADRLERLGKCDWGGPEIVFNVRNKLLHPPSSPKEPQWPNPDELVDAWQLATWYLQLSILRLLGYRGEYWSRLRLGRYGADTEPVPWAE